MDLDEMTTELLWAEAEEWLDSLAAMIRGRSYAEHSSTGIRHVILQVRRDLNHVERLLLEIEVRRGEDRAQGREDESQGQETVP